MRIILAGIVSTVLLAGCGAVSAPGGNPSDEPLPPASVELVGQGTVISDDTGPVMLCLGPVMESYPRSAPDRRSSDGTGRPSTCPRVPAASRGERTRYTERGTGPPSRSRVHLFHSLCTTLPRTSTRVRIPRSGGPVPTLNWRRSSRPSIRQKIPPFSHRSLRTATCSSRWCTTTAPFRMPMTPGTGAAWSRCSRHCSPRNRSEIVAEPGLAIPRPQKCRSRAVLWSHEHFSHYFQHSGRLYLPPRAWPPLHHRRTAHSCRSGRSLGTLPG